MSVGAGPTNAGGGTAGGETVATKVLALTGPGGLLAGAGVLELTVETPVEDAAALAGALNGLPAGCGFLPATASHATPANTTTTVAITSDRRGRRHRAGS